MRISTAQWTTAFGLAALLHGAVFAFAGRSSDDMERGRGAPAQEFGTALVSLDGPSNLLQELEPDEPVSSREQIEPVEQQASEQPVAEVPAVRPTEMKIEPVTESSVALAVPVEMLANPVEIKPVPEEKRQQAPQTKKKQKKKNNTATTRKGGGANGKRAGVSGSASFANYSGRVRSRVAGRAGNPGGAGTVVVRFTVTASGGVASANIVRGASSRLNSAVLRAVRGGFPPIPPGLPRTISFTLPIRFK